jgi:pimeloyl-ACP methyl ester carboxylesterase
MLETDRGAVECAESGEGPAVLLLHGGMGGYDQGTLLARAAAGRAGFRFVAISRPGYLATPLECGETPEAQADLCAAVLDAKGIKQTAVIAISGGGQCALQFAMRHRQRCSALVMISACSEPFDVPLPLAWYILQLAARVPVLAGWMRKHAADQPERAARRSIPDPALRARTLNHPEAGPLMKALQASTTESLAKRLAGTRNDIRQSRRRFDYRLEQITVPLLAVHGTADKVVPFAQSLSLAERVPKAELFAIEGGEHVSLVTHLDEIRLRVTGFLGLHAKPAA